MPGLDDSAYAGASRTLCYPNGTDNMGTLELAVVGLTGSGVGAALTLPLLFRAWRQSARPELGLLAGGLTGMAIVGAIISGRLLGFLPSTRGVNHALNLVGLATYPFIYLYVRAESGRPLAAARAWWLWLPCSTYAAAIVTLAAVGASTRIPFQWLLPVMLTFTVLLGSAARWRGQPAEGTLVAGRWLVVFFAVLNLAQIVRMLFGDVPLVPALIPAVLTSGFLAVVGLIAWRVVDPPGRLATIPDVPTSALQAERAVTARQSKSNLDETSAAPLLASIDMALSRDRLFADSALTLSGLAAAVHATPHQVSEVLNRHAGVSFHDLLNRRRVEDVKAQLADEANDRFTIEGIGQSAGFGSRSALYAAFRKFEGMTPAEWREQRRR